MRPARPGRPPARVGIGREAHARDVLGDGAIEEFDRLAHVADVPAERLLVPLSSVGAVEPDLAARQRPYADQAAHQRGLAGAARSDDRNRLPRDKREMNVGDDGGVAVGRARR